MESVLLLIKEDTKSNTSKRIMKIDIILDKLDMRSYHPMPDQTLSDILNPAEYKFEYLIINIEYDDIKSVLLKCKSLYPNMGILLLYDKHTENYEKNLNELSSTYGIKNSLEKNNISLNTLPEVLKQIKTQTLVQNNHTSEEKYVFMQNINSGAHGVVDLVFCSDTKKYLARKKIKLEGMSKRERNKVKEEENRMKEIKVPTVIDFIDSAVDNDYRYIYMEYCDAGSLEQFKNDHKLKGKNIPSDLVLDWMIEILIALFVLNKHSIIHRDIKAENILLKKEVVDNKEYLVAKLIDLGISRQMMEGLDFTLCGTPFYLCPEIATGLTRYDFNVDIWSLGVVMYEMLTLKKPFGDPSEEAHKDAGVSELYLAIRNDNYPNIPSEVPPKFHFLIRQMLRKNPNRRFGLTDLFRLDFVYNRFMQLINILDWKDKIPFVDELINLSKMKVGFYKLISLIDDEDFKILKDTQIILENVNYTPYKKSFFAFAINNTILGKDLLDCYEIVRGELNSHLSIEELFRLLFSKEILIPVSHPSSDINTCLENLQNSSSSSNYYKFSVNSIEKDIDNPFIIKYLKDKHHYNLVDLSQHVLDIGKNLIKELNKSIESPQDLIINKNYYEFIITLGFFQNFSVLELSYNDDDKTRLVFLLNLYQIMIIHATFKVFIGVNIPTKEEFVKYSFRDLTINNMELKHVVFRNNKKPANYFFRLVYEKDPKTEILPNFSDVRPYLIMPDINLNFCNDLINYKAFYFKNFNMIKPIDFQLDMLTIKFISYYINCYDGVIEIPSFIKSYISDFGIGDTPERPEGFLKLISTYYNKNKEEGVSFYKIDEKTKEQENLEIFSNFTLLLKKLKNFIIEYY